MIPSKNSALLTHAKYHILEEGDVIEHGDEYYNNFQDQWSPVEADTIGEEFLLSESKIVRRRNLDCSLPIKTWIRPNKAGNLRSILDENIECEVLESDAFMVTGIIKEMDKIMGNKVNFRIKPSPNEGFVIFEPIKN